MNIQKCKETITHLEKLQKQIWNVEGSLVDKHVKLNEEVRHDLFQARILIQLAEQLIREHLDSNHERP